MSVYDTTRAQAEQLCAQLNTPILRRADGDPMTAYDRLEFARRMGLDIGTEHDQGIWGCLSSGERELLRIASELVSIVERCDWIDERLRSMVGAALLESGAYLHSTGAPDERVDRMHAAADAREFTDGGF